MKSEYTYSVPQEESFCFFWNQSNGSQSVSEERDTDNLLAENLELARKINEQVNHCILYTPNYRARNNPAQNTDHMNRVFTQVCDLCNESQSQLKEGEWYQYAATIFAKYGVATCGGMSIVGGFLFKKDDQTPMSLCIIPEGNHEVLLIGEGKSAVVCDPFFDCYYPKDRCNLYLREVILLNTDHPVVKKTEKQLHTVFKIQ